MKGKFLLFFALTPLALTSCITSNKTSDGFKDNLVYVDKSNDPQEIEDYVKKIEEKIKRNCTHIGVKIENYTYSEFVYGTEETTIDYEIYQNSIQITTTTKSDMYRYGIKEKLESEPQVANYWLYRINEEIDPLFIAYKTNKYGAVDNKNINIRLSKESTITNDEDVFEELFDTLMISDLSTYTIYKEGKNDQDKSALVYSYQTKSVDDIGDSRDLEHITKDNYQQIITQNYDEDIKMTYAHSKYSNRDVLTNAWYKDETLVECTNISVNYSVGHDENYDSLVTKRDTAELFRVMGNREEIVAATLSYKTSKNNTDYQSINDYQNCTNSHVESMIFDHSNSSYNITRFVISRSNFTSRFILDDFSIKGYVFSGGTIKDFDITVPNIDVHFADDFVSGTLVDDTHKYYSNDLAENYYFSFSLVAQFSHDGYSYHLALTDLVISTVPSNSAN